MKASDFQGAVVIGYGNEWRGDDALGPEVARQVEARGRAKARVLIVHQLTPELAEPLASADRAVFVDAWAAPRSMPVLVEPIGAEEAGWLAPHVFEPRGLLALGRILYGRAPPAWLVTIAGERFAPGEPLSDAARRRARQAARRIEDLLRVGRKEAGRRRPFAPPAPDSRSDGAAG